MRRLLLLVFCPAPVNALAQMRPAPREVDLTAADDRFEIAIPAGYEVRELPAPVDADFPFASYHSKTESQGGVIRYTRNLEIKELSVPVGQVEELKRFYRLIAGDERSTVVLKAKEPGSR